MGGLLEKKKDGSGKWNKSISARGTPLLFESKPTKNDTKKCLAILRLAQTAVPLVSLEALGMAAHLAPAMLVFSRCLELNIMA